MYQRYTGFPHAWSVFSHAMLDRDTCRSLHWRHNGRDGISNHQPYRCLLNRLFMCRSKKTSKLRVTGLCAGNSPVTGEFPAQMTSNAENVSIWWRHHDKPGIGVTTNLKYLKLFLRLEHSRNSFARMSGFYLTSGILPLAKYLKSGKSLEKKTLPNKSRCHTT